MTRQFSDFFHFIPVGASIIIRQDPTIIHRSYQGKQGNYLQEIFANGDNENDQGIVITLDNAEYVASSHQIAWDVERIRVEKGM